MNTSGAPDEFEVPNMLDVERYAAIWPSMENADIDEVQNKDALNNDESIPSNVISFETKLCRSVTKKGSSNNASEASLGGGSRYEYAPKSFEIIIGLASTKKGNDGDDKSADKKEMESVFGLPLGVATLAINTQQQELEIPVLSLSQARPTIAVGELSMPCVEHCG